MSQTFTRLYDHPTETVVAAAACTWCGAQPGSVCTDLRWQGNGTYRAEQVYAHAQRWVDHWNTLCSPAERREVLVDPKRVRLQGQP